MHYVNGIVLVEITRTVFTTDILILGKFVEIHVHEKDRFGKNICRCLSGFRGHTNFTQV
jgi:hypothetical protein